MEQLAREIAGEARFQLISTGRNTYYRIWRPESTTVLKVYGSASLWRRENRAIESLGGVKGLPRVLADGTSDGCAWVEFADAGRWTLASMPENREMARKAGEILRAVHEADPGELSNLIGGMDQPWIESDYESTFERLGRYRRRLSLPGRAHRAGEGGRSPECLGPTCRACPASSPKIRCVGRRRSDAHRLGLVDAGATRMGLLGGRVAVHAQSRRRGRRGVGIWLRQGDV